MSASLLVRLTLLAVASIWPRPAHSEPHCCRWSAARPKVLHKLLLVVDDSTSVAKRADRQAREGFVTWAATQAEGFGVAHGFVPSVEVLRFPSETSTACGHATFQAQRGAPQPWTGVVPMRRPAALRVFTPLVAVLDLAIERAAQGDTLVILITDGVASSPDCRGDRLLEWFPRLPSELASRYRLVRDRFRFVMLGERDGDGRLVSGYPRPGHDDLFRVLGVGVHDPCRLPLEVPAGATLPLVDGCDRTTSPDTESTFELDEVSLLGAVRVGDADADYCTGVVLGPRAVLTARHCLPATHVRVERKREALERSVLAAHLHPDATIDAAILELEDDLGLVPPRRRTAEDTTPPMRRLRHIGFGRPSAGPITTGGARHIVNLFASGWGCDGEEHARRKGCRPGWELAVTGGAGVDTCDGDSGGPLQELLVDEVELDDQAPDADGRVCTLTCEWRVLGLTSRAVGYGARRCGEGGIYTRVDRLAPWITDTIERITPHAP
ncbi:MAG: trypsin-like serine protease [Deltaproteobacteria bacterium]|nr:trypsin-like serine protease [Deltaproteobacteria bacterium]